MKLSIFKKSKYKSRKMTLFKIETRPVPYNNPDNVRCFNVLYLVCICRSQTWRRESCICPQSQAIRCCWPQLSKNVASVGTQWEDHIFEEHCYIKRQHSVTYVNQSTQCDTVKPPSLINDYDSNLYTGLPLHTFHTLVAVLRPHGNLAYQTEIELQILLTLMKLKLNLLIEDLAIRFCISGSQVSRIISFWIDTMAVVLKDLIPWLPKETIRGTTPESFKQHYPNVTCILDCSESEVQRPRNLDSRSESYSHYYACNTIKY